MHGEKLKGEFALVHTHGRGDNSWLLIKHRDEFAKTSDITKKDKSVISGKTIMQVEKTSDNIYGQTKKPGTVKKAAKKSIAKKSPAKKTVTVKKTAVKKKIELLSGKKAAFPKDLQPMLATLVDKPFDEEGWQYEIKWDGYRTVAYCNKGKIELRSRNNKSFNEKFYPVYNALKAQSLNAVLDGEIIVSGESGISFRQSSELAKRSGWRTEILCI
jgi:bifunctional non-homologous end joining protein LigD